MADGLLGFQDPTNIGLLSAGLGILAQANGPNSRSAIGQGALMGLNAFQNAREGQAVEAYRTAQAQRLQQQGAMDQAKAAILQRFAGGGQTSSAPGAVQGGGLLGMGSPQGQPGGLLAGAVPAASPSATPQAGGAQGFPLSLNDVMQLKLAGIDVFDQYKYANDGIKREAGASYLNPVTNQMSYTPKVGEGQELVYGPNGPMVRALPGYSSAQAQAAGATAGATAAATLPYQIAQDRDRQTTGANLDLVAVPDGNGGTTMMPRSQAAGMLGGAGPGGSQGGGIGSAPSPTRIATGNKINEDWLTNSYRTTLDAGRTAGDLSNSLAAFRSIPLETGWGTEAKGAAANFLTTLGVAPESVQQYAGDVQRFQSIAMDRLQNSLMQQKGPQTEGDAQRAGKTFAQLGNTPQANKFIVDFAQAQANQQIRKAQYYEAALPLAQRDGDLTKVDREWRKVQGSIWNDPLLAPYRTEQR